MTGRPKLLLADDSVAVQKVIQLTLADAGIEVEVVGSGAEALRRLEESRPDIVLADISMPGPSGYDVCRWIKRDERFRAIPVILLVGVFEPFDEKEAREAGADDLLTKPFQSIREMMSKIGAYLTGRPTEEERYPEERPLSITSAAPPATSPPPPTSPPAREAPIPAYDIYSAPEPVTNTRASSSSADLATTLAAAPSASPAQDSDAFETDLAEVKPEPEIDDMKEHFPAAPTVAAGEAPGAPTRAENEETHVERPMPFASEERTGGAAGAPGPAAAMPVAAATAATDDSLLELGESASALTIDETDDFILDLGDEEPAVEPARGGRKAAAAAVAAPSSVASSSAAPGRSSSSAPGGKITLDQLAPEVIDAIAQRVVEKLSAKVVEEIAWEVVPQLSELLIKRQLEGGTPRRP